MTFVNHVFFAFPDYILDAPPVMSMTQTAQNVAEVYDLSREELDEFSVESQRRTAVAFDNGVYKDEIVSLEVETPVFDDEGNWLPDEKGKMIVFEVDENLRRGTNMPVTSTWKMIHRWVSLF